MKIPFIITLLDKFFVEKQYSKWRRFLEIEAAAAITIPETRFGGPEGRQKAVQAAAKEQSPDVYTDLRKLLSRRRIRLDDIAGKYGVPSFMSSGRPNDSQSILDMALHTRMYHLVDEQEVLELFERILGAIEAERTAAFWRMFNPFSVIYFVLGLPLRLLGATGVNIDKIESSLWGPVFRWCTAIVVITFASKLWGVSPIDLLNNFVSLMD